MEKSRNVPLTKFQKFLQGFVLGFGILLVNPSLVNPPDPPKALRWSSKDFNCLVEVLAHEGLNQPLRGQLAILEVVQNRKTSKGFPDSICKVVHQQKQFSYRDKVPEGKPLEFKPKNVVDERAFKKLKETVANFLLGNYNAVLSSDVKWYVRNDVKVVWMKKMKTEAVIASHTFMKEK